ncbi:MAG: hypothetical protein V4480_04535 [Patescibacteria group bacterium]
MLLRTITAVSMAVSLAACSPNGGSQSNDVSAAEIGSVFEEASGHIPGYEYELSPLVGKRGGMFKLFPTNGQGVRISSDNRISGQDDGGDGRWDMIFFCGSERRFEKQRSTACEFVRRNHSGSWLYIPCPNDACVISRTRVVNDFEIEPAIDALDAAREQAEEIGKVHAP